MTAERSPSAAKERAEPVDCQRRARAAIRVLIRHGLQREYLTEYRQLSEEDPVAADRLPDPEPQNFTEGMPPELVRALRDPTIRLPQDDYKLADGRPLWDHLQEWRNAPSGTASGGSVSAAVPRVVRTVGGIPPAAVPPAEPPERFKRPSAYRPEFEEHASPEAIQAHIAQARKHAVATQYELGWLEGLYLRRLAEKAAGRWP